ncbi:MAG: hypothetical protein GX025_05035, partial [Clostridiales bacterium]|nr:hypothetical protein [Clostridiales bacterium]
ESISLGGSFSSGQVEIVKGGREVELNVILEPANATYQLQWNRGTDANVFRERFDDTYDKKLIIKVGSDASIKKGTYTISVTDKLSNVKMSVPVYVSQPPDIIDIDGRNSYLVHETGKLSVTVAPNDADGSAAYIEWVSLDSNVATVDNGVITALKEGKTSIKAYYRLDPNISGVFPIAVTNTQITPAAVNIYPSGKSHVYLKGKLQLTVEVLGEGADAGFVYDKSVTWASSDDKIATVDQNGLVTPKAEGEVTITATSKVNNEQGSKTVKVEKEPINITKLGLSGGSTVKVGDKLNLKAAITPANATDRELDWIFPNNIRYTKVDELNYTIVGKHEGDYEITVRAKNNPSITATLKVKVTTASDKPDTEDGETQVITNVKPEAGTGDKKNEYTATIKLDAINEAIDKVIAESKRLGTIPVVKIKVETPASAVDLITSIPHASVGKLISDSSKAVLEVETGIGTMRLNAEALQRIYKKAYNNVDADIEIKMSRTVKTDLNEEQQKALGTRSVVELSIRSAGKEISSFDGYPITISLPFTLSSSQSGKGAQVDHLTVSGKLEPLKTDYNYKTKCVYFDITHLSYFSPYYLPSVAWDNPFTDVKSKDWFYDSVFYVVDRQLMQGISAERFVPESITTRGQIVTILHRLAGLPATKEANTFKDVKDGQWYTDAILWATENGLVNGYGGGLFGPEDEVTREQLGVMLHNYAKYVDITPKYGWDTPMKYPDSNKVSSWARQGAMYCQITGIITGRPGGGFEPQGTATRAELATMLLRMNDQMQKQLETQS